MAKPLLLLELNELSPGLLARFVEAGELPAFERLRSRCSTFVTDAGEEGERLNPWIQWVTVHTGVSVDEHGVTKLGDAGALRVSTVADAVVAAGKPVWLCGAMNVAPLNPVRGAWLPDPWSTGGSPVPAELEDFARYVRANVQEHTNHDAELGRGDHVAFVRFLVTHGLSPATVAGTAGQLLGEAVGRRPRRDRAVVLDRLQWDVFRWYFRRVHPTFASYFSNSTAHVQHVHWDQPDVLSAYRAHDALVASVLRWAGDDVDVALCTGLSQHANPELDAYEGFHRPRDLESFPGALGLPGVVGASPVMAEQFRLYFERDDAASLAASRLSSTRVAGKPAFEVRSEGRALFIGSLLFHPVAQGAVLETGARAIPVDDVLYWCDAPRRGDHDPLGAFWLPSSKPARNDGQLVPLTAVAPTLLHLLGITAPPSMTTPPLGAA